MVALYRWQVRRDNYKSSSKKICFDLKKFLSPAFLSQNGRFDIRSKLAESWSNGFCSTCDKFSNIKVLRTSCSSYELVLTWTSMMLHWLNHLSIVLNLIMTVWMELLSQRPLLFILHLIPSCGSYFTNLIYRKSLWL